MALTSFNISSTDPKGNGKVKDIKCPVLIYHGEKDLLLPVQSV